MTDPREEPRVPPELLDYASDDWQAPPAGEREAAHPGMRELSARERWRRAQDRFAHEHGLDRARFEAVAAYQRAARPVED
jgi:hypothetical protein